MHLELADDPLEITFDSAESLGLAPDELVGDDHGPTQRLAETLAGDGVSAMIAPSAALPGTRNLIVMDEAVVVDFHSEPIDPAYEWPAAQVARRGHPPDDLWTSVHYRSAAYPHPALEAWRADDEFLFVQPAVVVI